MKEITFSIVIPTYKRPRALARCLESVLSLDYPRDQFEVLVVHDGPADNPPEIKRIVRDSGIRFLVQPHSGPAAARNLGAREARFDVLAFVDDDCTVSKQWLRQLASNPGVRAQMMGGRTINGVDNCYAEASQMLIDFLYETFYIRRRSQPFLSSNNMCVPRDLFLRSKGFDETFQSAAGEDREFCYRWRSLAHEIVYMPEAEVFHHREMDLNSFWSQHFGYGRQARRLHQMLNAEHIRIRLEPFAFYRDLIFFPFRKVRVWKAIRLMSLMILSQAANALGFLSVWIRGFNPLHKRVP